MMVSMVKLKAWIIIVKLKNNYLFNNKQIQGSKVNIASLLSLF